MTQQLKNMIVIGLVLFGLSMTVSAKGSIIGIYQGITPCSSENRPVPHIPVDAECEMMSWELTLFEAAGTPTIYTLHIVYGIPKQGTTGFQDGAISLTLDGEWQVIWGTKTDPLAVVYQLSPRSDSIYLYRVNHDLIHVLSGDKSLLVGNAGWSYTLSRTVKGESPSTTLMPFLSAPKPAESASLPETDSGVFEGRMPCDKSLLALHDISRCNRVKLRLTLTEAMTYELLLVYVGAGDAQYITSGSWTMTTHAGIVVYEVGDLAFMQVENHLYLLDDALNPRVGYASASYTLSKTG